MSSQLSHRSKRVRDLVALFNRERLIKGRLVEARRNISEMDQPFSYPDYLKARRFWIGEMEAELLSYNMDSENPKVAHLIRPESEDWVILQLHGGGYVNAFKNQYRMVAGLYAEAGHGCNVLSIDYRVAPEHPFPAALEDAAAAYEWLLSAGFDAEHIVVAGDSAGGGLAMCLCHYLIDHHKKLPAGIVAMSPWTDLCITGESYESNYHNDPVFGGTRESLIYDNPYPGENDPHNPYISPLYGDFSEFPPMLIQVGTCEMLFSDAERVAQKALFQRCRVKYTVYPEMFHVFQVAGRLMEESRAAWSEVSKFLMELRK